MLNQLPIERHLALYTTFHQSHGNQAVHQLASPFVYFSAMLAIQALVPALVLPLLVASVAMLALADWKGAAVFGATLMAEWAASVWLSQHLGLVLQLLLAAVVQGGAWATLIFLGHGVFEPHLALDGQPASKGLYFERKYNLAEGLGASTNFFDRVVQFNIAPLAHANGLLFALGLRLDFAQRIAQERAEVVSRLQAGCTPFEESHDARGERRRPFAVKTHAWAAASTRNARVFSEEHSRGGKDAIERQGRRGEVRQEHCELARLHGRSDLPETHGRWRVDAVGREARLEAQQPLTTVLQETPLG